MERYIATARDVSAEPIPEAYLGGDGHDPASDFGHGVAADGLDVDIYRDGQQYRTE